MANMQEQGPHYSINDTKNSDLLRERQTATFDVEQLTQFMFASPDSYMNINKRRQISRLAYAHPIHKTHLPLEYLDADEFYSVLIRKSMIAIKEAERLNITENRFLNWFLSNFVNGRFPFGLHMAMFIPTLETMATDEQKAKFLPLARSFRIIGTYVQTELGHGSSIQQLETEAVFDRATDSFILNTPTLTATKFWPGALGRSTNYALVMAQLYTPDRNHPRGLQMFFVQIRDLDTHEPMPGVEVGEISTRFAHDVADNGYLRLTNVRIPRNHMLMKLSSVDEHGDFQQLADPRLLYGVMLSTRVNLCILFASSLARATTIAVRYSAVRRQGKNPKGQETLIIDYPLQQEKLIPCIATTYAFYYTFVKLEKTRANMLDREVVLLEQLPELHALSSGLKAYLSGVSERMSQVCRVACGGHGFLVASGIKPINNMLDACCTLEGDNAVLLQQTARYLLKLMEQTVDENDINTETSTAYLFQNQSAPTSLVKPDDYCCLFECRSRLILKSMSNRLNKVPSTVSSYDKFSQHSIELVHVAKAYIETYILRAFYYGLCQASQYKFGPVFEQLFKTFAIHTIRSEPNDFIRLNLLTAEQIYQLETYGLPELYAQIRPNMVTLLDAFDFHDNELNSCLGRYDGQVYEALMERARMNPSNRFNVHPVWTAIKQNTISKL